MVTGKEFSKINEYKDSKLIKNRNDLTADLKKMVQGYHYFIIENAPS